MDIKAVVEQGKTAFASVEELVKKIIPEGALRDQMLESLKMDPNTIGFLESCKNIEMDKRDEDSLDPFRSRWHSGLAWASVAGVVFYLFIWQLLNAFYAVKHGMPFPAYDAMTLMSLIGMLLGYKTITKGMDVANDIHQRITDNKKDV